MAQEIIRSGFYAEDEKRWIDIHQSAKICLELYLARALFKNDLSRIIYATPDMTFRRRTELLDADKTELRELTPVSLNLPYASYYQSGEWENDDRIASQQAGQMLKGQYDLTSNRYIRARAVKAKYKATLFFSRRDDVRMADQMLGWEANPEGDARFFTQVEWRENTLGIPMNITIDSVNTSPDYKETDFLAKSRIFPVEVEFTIRSYQVHINKYNSVITLPVRFENYRDDYDWGDPLYLTEKTTLDFAMTKFGLDNDTSKVDISDKVLNYQAPLYFTKEGPFTEEELRAFSSKLPNEYTRDILRGYFEEQTSVAVNVLRLNKGYTTPTKAYINYKIKPADFKHFKVAKFIVPAHGEVEITDCKADHFEVDGLYPNSTYNCKLLVYSMEGDVSTYNLSFTTPPDEKSDTKTNPEKITGIPGLVGMHL